MKEIEKNATKIFPVNPKAEFKKLVKLVTLTTFENPSERKFKTEFFDPVIK